MSKPAPYRESQIGWLFLSLMTPVLLFVAVAYYQQWGSKPPTATAFYFTMVLLIGVCLVFYGMQTHITYRNIKIRYGIGLVKINPKVDELIAVEVTRTPRWYGLGARITPKGWLYNIHGRDVACAKASATEHSPPHLPQWITSRVHHDRVSQARSTQEIAYGKF